MSDVNIECDMI